MAQRGTLEPWRNSLVTAAPPATGRRSSTSTDSCCRASSAAAMSPFDAAADDDDVGPRAHFDVLVSASTRIAACRPGAPVMPPPGAWTIRHI